MSDSEAASWKPLFWTDPERFTKEVLAKEDDSRFRQYKDARDCLFGEIARYGFYSERTEWIAPLRSMYDEFVDNGMSVEQRGEVLQHLAVMVENTKTVAIGVFLPFICQDPDRGVVSTASLEYMSLGPLLNDDAMTRPKELVRLIKNREPRNCGAVFGAMLVLGDPRLCKLLWPLKDQLTFEEVREATQCTSGFVSAATIDFVLDWLEEIQAATEGELFGSLLAHLVLQRRHMQAPFVATGQRSFPVTGISRDEQQALMKLVPLDRYITRIAPRLLALAEAESEPEIMPHVLREWGITSPSQSH